MLAPWPTDVFAELESLCRNGGLTATTMAARLNLKFGMRYTRNAVISQINRHGLREHWSRARLEKNGSTGDLAEKSVRVVASKPENRGAMSSGLRRAIENCKKPPPLAPDDVATDLEKEDLPTRVPLLMAEPHHCRWPAADDGSATMVCGGLAPDGQPYCAHHSKIATRPRQKAGELETA